MSACRKHKQFKLLFDQLIRFLLLLSVVGFTFFVKLEYHIIEKNVKDIIANEDNEGYFDFDFKKLSMIKHINLIGK